MSLPDERLAGLVSFLLGLDSEELKSRGISRYEERYDWRCVKCGRLNYGVVALDLEGAPLTEIQCEECEECEVGGVLVDAVQLREATLGLLVRRLTE